jgi:transcriptional regulator
MSPIDASEPEVRGETIRQALLRHLREGPLTAKDLSARIGIREKDVAAHLAHLQKSLRRTGEVLAVEPAQCLGCGYVFERREKLSRPSACPRCRGQRLEPPVFAVVAER